MSCNDMIQVTCFCYLLLQIRPTALQYLTHHKKTINFKHKMLLASPVHNKQSSSGSGVSSGRSVIVYIQILSYGSVLENRIFRWFFHIDFLNLIRVLANTVTMDKFIFSLFITYFTEKEAYEH